MQNVQTIDPVSKNLVSPDHGDFSPEKYMAAMAKETGRGIYLPGMVKDPILYDIPDQDIEPLQKALGWTESFIIKSHPQYGLKKAVCPFVKPSMDINLLYMAVLRVDNPESLDELYTEMNVYRDMFLKMGPIPEHMRILRCFMLLLPDTPGHLLDDLMETPRPDTGESLKTEWLRHGIMMGQFYPACPFKSTLNAKLKTHQSPVPFYAVRPFIESDWRFLRYNEVWKAIYKARYGEPSFVVRHRTLHKLYTGFLKTIRPNRKK